MVRSCCGLGEWPLEGLMSSGSCLCFFSLCSVVQFTYLPRTLFHLSVKGAWKQSSCRLFFYSCNGFKCFLGIMLNTSSLPLKMDLLSSEAYYLQPKLCVFLAWLQLLPPPPLLFCSFLPWRKRQRKGKKMEEGNMVANIVTASPDSLFLSLEKVTLATVTLSLSASELSLSFLIIITFPWDMATYSFLKIGVSSWNFLETSFFSISEYVRVQLKQIHRLFTSRTTPWFPQWKKVLSTQTTCGPCSLQTVGSIPACNSAP